MSYLKKLQTKYCLAQLFGIGPYNRFSNGRRVELEGSKFSSDNLSDKLRLIEKATEQVNALIEEAFSSSGFFVVLKFEEYTNKMETSIDSVLNGLGINEFKIIETESYEDEDDELYNILFLIEMKNESIQKIIRAFLARHIDFEPHIMAELFFIERDMSQYANLYDDRGIDFIYLK